MAQAPTISTEWKLEDAKGDVLRIRNIEFIKGSEVYHTKDVPGRLQDFEMSFTTRDLTSALLKDIQTSSSFRIFI